MATIKEHDRVVLTADVREHKLAAGDVGTVVHVYGDERAYEVEFVALSGETVALVTLDRDKLRAVEPGEITHARRVA